MAFPLYPLVGTGQATPPVVTGVSALFSANNQSYMTFTPSVTSNNKTMTFACWVRRGNTAINNPTAILPPILQANAGSTFIGFDSVAQNADCLYVITPGVVKYEPIDVFRDSTGWFHLCVAIDTTQSNPNNRIQTWINGVPSSSSFYFQNYPAQNGALDFNTAGVVNQIGGNSTTNNYFDGYLTDIYMLDGIAATPASFTTGTGPNCRPISYSGAFGTNGYHLSTTDGANLGEDSSGNGNNWGLVNINSASQQNESVNSTYNLLCVYNTEVPFNPNSFINGLQGTSINHFRSASGTQSVTSGKWYWELQSGVVSDKMVGIMWDTYTTVGFPGNNQGPGGSGYPQSWMFRSNGTKNSNGIALAYGSAWNANDVIGIALDMDNSKIYFSINGTWQGGGDPVGGSNPAYTFTSGLSIIPALFGVDNTANDMNMNFGAPVGGFNSTPPTGYSSMISTTLPASVISNPRDYAAPFVYTGTGSTLNISSLNFQPDIIFTRLRAGSSGTPMAMYDSVRGVGAYLDTSSSNGQVVDAQSLTAFTSNGFTLGTSNASNISGGNYMGFAIKSNPANGFVALTYTGDGTTNRNIAHTLGVSPDLMWVKRIDSTGDWYGYFSTFPNQVSYYKPNNSTLAVSTANSPWGSGGITASQFSVSGNATNNLNVNTATYVVYMWANTTGLFNIGSYAGNGGVTTAGRCVFNRMRPSWIYTVGGTTMVDAIYDVARNPFNPANYAAYFSQSTDEASTGTDIDIYSIGFDCRHQGALSNLSATYYYMVFGDAPYNSTTAR